MSDVAYDGPAGLVHLHTHTIYSTLDGVATPEQLFSACKQRGWPALAITEHGQMASVPDNYFAAKANGIKYIPGCEIYFNDYELDRQKMVADGGKIGDLKLSDPKMHQKIMRNRHLTVLAKNQVGFTNLVKLTTRAYEIGFYYRPRIWFEELSKHGDGLVILSGCLNGPIANGIRNNEPRTPCRRGFLDYIERFHERWGDDYWIEVQQPCLTEVEDFKVFWILNHLGKKYGIKRVLANDAHYLDRKDFMVQKVMMAIDQGVTVDSPDLFHVNSDEQYFKTRAELFNTFKTHRYSEKVTDAEFHEMCDNTLLVAESCENYKPDLSPKVPSLPDDKAALSKAALSSLRSRGLDKCERKFWIDNREVTYMEQMKIELKRFNEKNFNSYFLITQDLVQYSLNNGWPVGPRGSVGGSLVCYLLGITGIDPLVWGLSFDRFLSPSRGGTMLRIKAE